MQKTFLFLLLLPAFAFAQKRVVQQAAYAGFGTPYISVGYDARFRSTTGKPDFALGAGLHPIFSNEPLLYPFGVGLQASALFGKTHAFEIGVSGNLGFATRWTYEATSRTVDYRTMLQNMVARPLIGYRFQSADKRFFLQAHYHPLILTNSYVDTYNGTTIRGFESKVKTSFNDKEQIIRGAMFALRLGFNLNVLKDTATTNTAYEAPAKDKIVLQHAVTLGLADGLNGECMYDLRWRSPNDIDAAINLSALPFMYKGYAYSVQALALFLQGKANIEAGLMWQYEHNVYKSLGIVNYYGYTSNSNFIGLPIGFRLQPRRGFFMRCYAAPFKYVSFEQTSGNGYKPDLKDYHTILDGVRLGVGLGYTF
jgi:hypothetical protein